MFIIIQYVLMGAGIGAIIAIGLFVLGFAIEILNIGCAIITCNCNQSMVFDWSGSNIWSLIWMFAAGGAIIGLFYGIFSYRLEKENEKEKKSAEEIEKARRLRISWASSLKQQVLDGYNICVKNQTQNESLVDISYKADIQMNYIMDELIKINEQQAKINLITNELTNKGEL